MKKEKPTEQCVRDLQEARNELIIELGEALKIPEFLNWLNNKLNGSIEE